jgi:hypothetical protein
LRRRATLTEQPKNFQFAIAQTTDELVTGSRAEVSLRAILLTSDVYSNLEQFFVCQGYRPMQTKRSLRENVGNETNTFTAVTGFGG